MPTPKASKAKTAPVKRFEAPLERMRSRLNWIIIRMPFDAASVWGLRGQIKVKGEINGFGFRTSLFPTGDGQHYLLVNKRMQKGSRAFEGSVAKVQIERDVEKRVVHIPPELKSILDDDRQLRRWFDKLSHSPRTEIAKWVADPKSAEARERRAEQMAERMLSVMDAERELPPILQVAFARNPQARDGWAAMSMGKRRGHLYGIFYYRNPESQTRRIDKMLDEATAVAERISNKRK
jgi:uncharacterized protein YdeI (YjbR/CyaY-like superfamily)